MFCMRMQQNICRTDYHGNNCTNSYTYSNTSPYTYSDSKIDESNCVLRCIINCKRHKKDE